MQPREESSPLSAQSAAAAPDVLLLHQCPVCAYSLEGLPVEHRCPECGLRFDRRWHVFGGTLAMTPASVKVKAAVLFAAIAVLSFDLYLLTRGGRFALFAFQVTLPVVFMLLAFYRRPSRWLAITPAGLRLYRGRKLLEEFPWDTFDQVWFVFTGDLELRGPHGVRKINPKRLVGRDPGDPSRIVNAINAYPHRPPRR